MMSTDESFESLNLPIKKKKKLALQYLEKINQYAIIFIFCNFIPISFIDWCVLSIILTFTTVKHASNNA